MRIVFMGSAELSCPSLATLLRSREDELAGVVCQPDRPQGRALHVAPCAVKKEAEQSGVRILTPDKINAPESIEAIRALRPDLFVVIAYGQILRPALLAIPPRGSINLHVSLLPRYRGAAPVQWAIANGESLTGVTAMLMNEGLDSGDILLQQSVPIAAEDTGATLHDKLGRAAAELLVRTLDELRRGTLARRPQNERDVTYAPKLKKADGKIIWSMPAGQINNRVRAFNPWPGSFCVAAGGRLLKVLRVREEAGGGAAGQVLEAGAGGPLVAAGEGAVRLLDVQPEGRRAMSGADYAHGHALRRGDVLQ